MKKPDKVVYSPGTLLHLVFLSAVLLQGTTALAQHGLHPTMPGMEFTLHVYLGDKSMPEPLDVQLDLASTAIPGKLNQKVLLPAPWPSVTLLEYLPNAQLRQTVTAADGGQPAVQLAIEGPTQSYQRWLIAGDQDRNRLTSFIGTWRMMSVTSPRQRDILWSQFETELTRQPMLTSRKTGSDTHVELPAVTGKVEGIPDSGCKIKVLEFMPHYGLDQSTSRATNQSSRRINPAAHVEINCAGTIERRWVFSKFPTYSTGDSSTLDVQVSLDCPVDSQRKVPDYLLIALANGKLELWSRTDGKSKAQSIEPDAQISIVGSQYTFKVESFMQSAQLHETFVSADKGGTPAVRFAMDLEKGRRDDLWLARSKPRSLRVQPGSVTLVFDSSGDSWAKGH